MKKLNMLIADQPFEESKGSVVVSVTSVGFAVLNSKVALLKTDGRDVHRQRGKQK